MSDQNRRKWWTQIRTDIAAVAVMVAGAIGFMTWVADDFNERLLRHEAETYQWRQDVLEVVLDRIDDIAEDVRMAVEIATSDKPCAGIVTSEGEADRTGPTDTDGFPAYPQ